MTRKPKCPMMMYGMPMLPMMQGMPAFDMMDGIEEMDMPEMMGMPNMMNMMNMPMMDSMEMEHHYEDEEDDRYFMKMYPESCKRMMPYIREIVDKMEEKGSSMLEEYPDREMIRRMTEDVYKSMVKDMPEMAEEEETRQYAGRRFTRDLLALLLLNELFRRRRRRRRRSHGYPYDSYGYGREEDYDYYYRD